MIVIIAMKAMLHFGRMTVFFWFLAVIGPCPANAHEFWIAPQAWQLPAGAELLAAIRVGTGFKGSQRIYAPQHIARFDLIGPTKALAFTGRLGDRPAGRITPVETGLHIIRHETNPLLVRYANMAEFAEFAEEKGYPDAPDQHRARGLHQDGLVETYRRFAKTLVAIGAKDGDDRRLGMEVEITALDNPFSLNADTLALQLDADGAPWAAVQVTVFQRPLDTPGAEAKETLYRSDDLGRVDISVVPGHAYLVDAVHLGALPAGQDAAGAVWESRWASLSFALPETP